MAREGGRRTLFPTALHTALVAAGTLAAIIMHTATPRAIMPDWQSAKPYTAVVSSTEANFVFELPAREEWEWRLPETRLAGLEYEWTVKVRRSNDQSYQFGYFLFNFPSQQPSHGDLRTLLQQGQWSIGQGSQIAGGTHLQKPMKVEGIASPTRLVLTIRDPATLQAIFSDRPTEPSERPVEATFSARIPGQAVSVRTAPIVYQ